MLPEMSDSIYPKDCNLNPFLQHEGIPNTLDRNTVQKVAGTLRVPSAEPLKALLFEGYGTWNVPTTFLLH
jgi:hypothetical protein